MISVGQVKFAHNQLKTFVHDWIGELLPKYMKCG